MFKVNIFAFHQLCKELTDHEDLNADSGLDVGLDE